ncbi:MAG: alpha-hydroxy-acid oxidizing protein, partial [Pseudonocardiaceae bacterium]
AMAGAIRQWVELFGNPELGWADLSQLRQWTRLPILIKGICHPDDARAALDHGADAVVVSNHGGRQVDGARAALDCLPEVLAAVGERAPVLLDSGIRCGADVLIALALGARAVLLGRPWVYGLGLAGQRGVEHVLRVLLGDLDLTLALAGYASSAELDTHSVVREGMS